MPIEKPATRKRFEEPKFGTHIIEPFKQGHRIYLFVADDRSKLVMATYHEPSGYPRNLWDPKNPKVKTGERHAISIRNESRDGVYNTTFLAVDLRPKGDHMEVTVGPKPASISGVGPVTEHELNAAHAMMKERGFEPMGEPAHKVAPKGEVKGSAVIKYRKIR